MLAFSAPFTMGIFEVYVRRYSEMSEFRNSVVKVRFQGCLTTPTYVLRGG